MYLKNGVWDYSGCEISNTKDNSCEIKVVHSSTFTVQSVSLCERSYMQIGVLCGILVLLGVGAALNHFRFAKALKKLKGPSSNLDKGLEGEELGELNQPKQIEGIEKESFVVRFSRNHLLLNQICHSQCDSKSIAALFLGAVLDLTFSGVLIYSLEMELEGASDYIAYILYTALLTLSVVGMLDVLVTFAKSLYSSIFMVTAYLTGCGGVAVMTFSSCGEYEDDWMILFVGAAVLNFLVVQSLVAALKTSIKSN